MIFIGVLRLPVAMILVAKSKSAKTVDNKAICNFLFSIGGVELTIMFWYDYRTFEWLERCELRCWAHYLIYVINIYANCPG